MDNYQYWLIRKNQPSDKKKKKRHLVFFSVLAVLIALFLIDAVIHPFQGGLYQLVGVKKEEITEVRISHFGKTLRVTEPGQVDEIAALFDCNLKRLASDYIGHRTGGDWFLVFVTEKGKESKGFGFFPSDGREASGPTQVHIGHYDYYVPDKTFDDTLILGYWEAEFRLNH